MKDNHIYIRRVSVSFPSAQGIVRVLREADMTLRSGAVTALVGESGSGKSILGAAVLGLNDPEARTEGEILYQGRNLLTLTEQEINYIRGKRIAWIAQDPVSAMDPVMPVGKQVGEMLSFRGKLSKKDAESEGTARMARFGLESPETVSEKYPFELSGGMAQRVLMAMMTAEDPVWLIADEPTKGLDAFARRRTAAIFRAMKENRNVGILLITHDLELAAAVSSYAAVMYAGQIVEYGPAEDVLRRPVHPYTRGFAAAQPKQQMKPIPGTPPDLSALPEGCIFAPRCPFYWKPMCRTEQRMRIMGDRQVRCWKKEVSQ